MDCIKNDRLKYHGLSVFQNEVIKKVLTFSTFAPILLSMEEDKPLAIIPGPAVVAQDTADDESEEVEVVDGKLVMVPEKQMPLKVPAVATGIMRKTRMGDFPEVYEHACFMLACWAPDRDVRKELMQKFGLCFNIGTIAAMSKLRKYGPIIDRMRRRLAVGKIREVPYAYRFKRIEKLSDVFAKTNDPRDLALLDESLRREMEKIEESLFDSSAEQEMTEQAKQGLIVQTAIKMLGNPNIPLGQLEDKLVEVADRIRRRRELESKMKGAQNVSQGNSQNATQVPQPKV